MILAYRPLENALARADDPVSTEGVVWIDLHSPDQETLERIGRAVGAELPTLGEMEEIELSSRLYLEDGVGYLTATVPYGLDSRDAALAPVSFVLTPSRLVTVRHHEHRAFTIFPQRASKAAAGCATAAAVLTGLLDAISGRIADILERAAHDIDALSRSIFRPEASPQGKSRNFATLLQSIGRHGDLVSKLRESLASLERLFGFLGPVVAQQGVDKEVRGVVKAVARDVHSLIEYAEFLSQKISFMLEAMMGMINIEQNGIIKIFSVVAVVFLPPTLIASIYGMNFDVMPELDWWFGYPLAVGLMILSAVLPYLYFKRRGWL